MHRAEGAGSSVVDEEIDGSEVRGGFFDERGNLLAGRNVGGHGENVDARGVKAGACIFKGTGVAGADGNAGAKLAQAFGDGESDATAGSRDQSGGTGERGIGFH